MDRVGYEGRRWMLPEVVVRGRARGDLNGLRHVAVLGDGYRLILRRHCQGAGRDAGLELVGAHLGSWRVGFEVQRLELF